jgi:GxxExxY protein
MAELIFPDESYEIVGAAMKVFNELGFGYQEKYYYRALKLAFLALGYKVTEQLWTALTFEGKSVGGYYLDFLLEKDLAKIIVELKIANAIYVRHIRQIFGYLKANDIKLGIIIVFSTNGVLHKRIVN